MSKTKIFLSLFLKLTLIAFISLSDISPVYAVDSSVFFSTEQAAHQHCPADTVVWENTKTGVYHFKGQRWYGNTKEGAYVCQKDANNTGGRATRNGQ